MACQLALPSSTSKTPNQSPFDLRTYVRMTMITPCPKAHSLAPYAAFRLKYWHVSWGTTTPTNPSFSLVETLDLNLNPPDISREASLRNSWPCHR